MNTWNEKTLGEVTSYLAKGIPPKYTEVLSGSSIYVLNQKCNRDFRISYGQARMHDLTKKNVKDEKMLLPGDVLINSTGVGTAGRIAQIWDIPYPTTTDGHMVTIRPTDEIDPLFYGYAVKSNLRQIEHLAEGSTGQTELNKTRLKNEVIIRYPESKEAQHNIAQVLKKIDDKILVNEAINRNLEEQATALFNETLNNSSSISFTNLEDVAVIKGGKRLPKGKQLITEKSNHPYIRVRDLNNVIYASLNQMYEYVDDDTQKTIARYTVNRDDVLISIVGTIGLSAIVDSTLDGANLTENCVKLTDFKNVTPEYILMFLRSVEGKNAIKIGTVGAVQSKLPIKNIKAISLPILSDDEFSNLNESLVAIFRQISSNVQEVRTLSEMRDTLLPKLMSGELDVSGLDI